MFHPLLKRHSMSPLQCNTIDASRNVGFIACRFLLAMSSAKQKDLSMDAPLEVAKFFGVWVSKVHQQELHQHHHQLHQLHQ